VHLERGDGVLFCTDGIVEARSPDGHFFGDERLTDLVAEIDDVERSAEVVRRGLHAVMDYQEGAPRDDATMLLLRRSSEVAPATSP
jgi:serine phosphatase RsbU (regulator of sigma subunit)